MSFSINTNVASLQAQQYLRATSDFQQKTIGRVTSGLRITSSGDDAAGLAIANGYRSDQAVLTQGVRNVNDGLSQLQIADGGINNISQLLDRARSLATQSASGTFAGDRGVLNSEFKSVLSEIDRQAQVIGLDTGGVFAKNLSVFIGGGKTNAGVNAITNGSVGVDLSHSTVDARSLGLQGVQAAGVVGSDIGNGSPTTSVAQIVANSNNVNSEGTAGSTDFYFQGPGFASGNRIKVSVNLSGVADTGTLVTAVNAAIQAAGNSGSQYGTAFKNANITASVVTDANGAQRLGFNSAVSAFQAEAGDKTSNALLGNFKTGVAPEGADLTTTLTGAGNVASGSSTFGAAGAGTITVRLTGSGLSAPIDVSIAVGAATTVNQALTSLSTQVGANSSLKAAGISLTTATAGSALVFTGAHGEKLKVDVTGDVQNKLGLGSFVAGNAAEFDYGTIHGATYNLNTSAAGTDSTLQISLNGQASSANAISVDLTAGDATAATTSGTDAAATVDLSGAGANILNLAVNGTQYQVTLSTSATTTKSSIAAAINSAVGSAVASVDNTNHLVLTSNVKGAGGSLQILSDVTAAGSGANAALGLTAGTASFGTSRSGASVAAAVNSAIAANSGLAAAGLQATFGSGQLTIASSNNTNFRLDAIGVSAATSGKITGKNTAATVNTTSGNNLLSLNVDGTAVAVTLTSGASVTKATLATDIQSALTAAGLSATATVDTNTRAITIASATTGAASSVQILSGTANAGLGLTVSSATGTEANLGFGTAGASFTGNTASAAPTGSAQVDAGGSSQTAALTFSPILNGSDAQTITFSANDSTGSAQTKSIVLRNDNTSRSGRSIDEALSAINTSLQQTNNATLQQIVAVKDNVGGTEKVRFLSNLSSFNVSIGTNGGNAGIGSQGTIQASATNGAGSTSDIATQSGALAAVTALSNAVGELGKAQAVVGRGQNQFNYAINLAQSQLSNLSSAESRIRDADLASEAANLTKAQILLQAGIAALAQANSAPQQVLTLLRG